MRCRRRCNANHRHQFEQSNGRIGCHDGTFHHAGWQLQAQEEAKRSPSGSPPTVSTATSSGGGSSTSPSNFSVSNTAPNFRFSPTPGGLPPHYFRVSFLRWLQIIHRWARERMPIYCTTRMCGYDYELSFCSALRVLMERDGFRSLWWRRAGVPGSYRGGRSALGFRGLTVKSSFFPFPVHRLVLRSAYFVLFLCSFVLFWWPNMTSLHSQADVLIVPCLCAFKYLVD